MRIIVDAMGGDFAPFEQIKGCIEAKKELDCAVVLAGNREIIEKCAKDNGLSLDGLEILHAENSISMSDPPLTVRSKPDTSLRVGLTALAEKKADAFVSAGSTGAVQTGATLFVRRIPGVFRSAIGTVLPFQRPALLLDSGANATFTPEMLVEYAIMGSAYMAGVCGVKDPAVGLLNIGTEEHKGTKDHAAAYGLLKEAEGINFIGNVEPTSLPFGVCDVLVTDGFTGNILLKSVEGMAKYIFSGIKDAYMKNFKTKVAGAMSKDVFKDVKKQFDATEYGGAPLLGIAAPVIKAHGNSNAKAICSAVRQAYRYAECGAVGHIEAEIAKRKAAGEDPGAAE